MTEMEIYLGTLKLKQVSPHQKMTLVKTSSMDEISRQMNLKRVRLQGMMDTQMNFIKSLEHY